MKKKLKLVPYILKRYEPGLDCYFFHNARSGALWKTDYETGTIISSLDGTRTKEDIVNLLASNSPDVSVRDLETHFYNIFDFLLKEGFIGYAN